MPSRHWFKNEYIEYWQGQSLDLSLRGYSRNKRLPDLFKSGEKVLDLGSGYGAVSRYLARERACSIVAMDISRFACAFIRHKLSLPAVMGDTAAGLPFSDETFDTTFWGDNAEHLLDPLATLLEIRRVTRRGGRVVVTCPNTASFTYRWRYLVYGIVWNVEASRNPPWRWQHIRFFNQTTMRKMALEAGLRVIKFWGAHDSVWMDPLARAWPSMLSPVLMAELGRD